MAIFNSRELEALKAERDRLKEKIALYETRMSVKDETIRKLRGEIDRLTLQADEFRESIEEYKDRIARSTPSSEVDAFKQHHQLQIKLLEYRISQLQTRPHNERGAGRKRKATPEQIETILSLHTEGISQAKIAQILCEQSGEKWNKSTVRNVILAAKN